ARRHRPDAHGLRARDSDRGHHGQTSRPRLEVRQLGPISTRAKHLTRGRMPREEVVMTEKATDTHSPERQAAEAGSDVPRDPAGQAADSAGGEAAEVRKDDIEELRRQAEDNWGQYLRAVAEIDNLRKRNARELENARKYGAEKLAQALLP